MAKELLSDAVTPGPTSLAQMDLDVEMGRGATQESTPTQLG